VVRVLAIVSERGDNAMSRRRRTSLIGGVLVLSAFLSGRASPAIAVTFDGVYVATVEVGSTTAGMRSVV